MMCTDKSFDNCNFPLKIRIVNLDIMVTFILTDYFMQLEMSWHFKQLICIYACMFLMIYFWVELNDWKSSGVLSYWCLCLLALVLCLSSKSRTVSLFNSLRMLSDWQLGLRDHRCSSETWIYFYRGINSHISSAQSACVRTRCIFSNQMSNGTIGFDMD